MMIMDLVDTNANRGVETEEDNPFVVNSLLSQLDAPIALMLFDFNATTFRHDARSNETAFPNCARIHRTHYTTQLLDLVHANMPKASLMLRYAINVVERVPPFHRMPLHGFHPITVH